MSAAKLVHGLGLALAVGFVLAILLTG